MNARTRARHFPRDKLCCMSCGSRVSGMSRSMLVADGAFAAVVPATTAAAAATVTLQITMHNLFSATPISITETFFFLTHFVLTVPFVCRLSVFVLQLPVSLFLSCSHLPPTTWLFHWIFSSQSLFTHWPSLVERFSSETKRMKESEVNGLHALRNAERTTRKRSPNRT